MSKLVNIYPIESKECCENCKQFEDWRTADDKVDGICLPGGNGWCEWYGDTENDDPKNVTCFEFERRDDEEE